MSDRSTRGREKIGGLEVGKCLPGGVEGGREVSGFIGAIFCLFVRSVWISRDGYAKVMGLDRNTRETWGLKEGNAKVRFI